MKKIFRFQVIMSFVACLSASALSCTEDAVDENMAQIRADLVDVHVGEDKRVDYVLTDDDDSLRTKPTFTTSWIETGDTIYRAILYYKMNEGFVDGISMGQVLVPSIKPADRIKGGMKTDPVHLASLWRARNGCYLNLRLRVMTGTIEGEKLEKQIFGCAVDTLMQHADGRSTLSLRLYHDQGNQPEYYSKEIYLSIPLQGVKADTLLLQVNTYEGIKEKKIIV